MRPALYPDDGSCGGASDVAVNGEKTFIIKSDNSSSVSVYLLSEPKGTSSSKSAAADEKGTPEAREIWQRMKVMTAAKPGGTTSEYVVNKLCHCCRKAKHTGVKFHCGKHTYCSSHFEKRLGFPAVYMQQNANGINHCPVCILTCTCKACNERLMAVTQIMKSECTKQGCGPSEVQMDNLFELCTATPSSFASIAKSGETSRSSSNQAEKTFDTTKASKSSAAAQKTSSTGTKSRDNLDKLWYETLERLKPCIVNGKMDYSSLTDEKAKKQLNDFVYRQRKHFRMRQNNEDSPLTNERFEALSAANFPFELQKSASIQRSKSSTKKDIIVSLRDPSYKQIMEEYFKKLGPKTNQIEEGKLTEREAVDEVYVILKNKGGRFVRLTNPHNLNDGCVEIDDEEALKKIRNDINRRMESAKRWLHSKSSAKDSSSASKQLKRKNVDKNDEHPTKRPCKSTDQDETRHVNPPQAKKGSRSKSSVKGCPLQYVGNYIANHVGGWDAKQRTNSLGFDHYVIYRTGCDKKSALEGKDKFTGYDELAVWAFKTGYYTKHVVETEEGTEILEKLGIESDPYSIFNNAANQTQLSGLHTQAGEPLQQQIQAPASTTASSKNAREERQDNHLEGRQVVCPQNSGSDSNSKPAEEPFQQRVQSPENAAASLESAREEQQDNFAGSQVARAKSSGAQLKSNSAEPRPAEVESPLARFKRFRLTASNLNSSLASAQERGDELGIRFFSHLEGWLGRKSKEKKFVMQFRSDDIDEAVGEFNQLMEQIESTSESEGNDTFKNLVDILIDHTRQLFPLR